MARALTGALVARLRDGGTPVATVLVVQQATGSFAVAGWATGAAGLAAALSRPLHGRLLDRRGQRMLLPVAFLNSAMLAALVAAATTGAAPAVLVATAALGGLVLPAQGAALRALLPRLVDRDLRPTVYAVEANAQELSAVAGPALVALLVLLRSPAAALLTLAVLGVAGTALYTTGAAARAAPAHRGRPGTSGTVLRSPGLGVLMLAMSTLSLALGVVQLAFSAFAARHGSPATAGALVAAFTVGSVLGGAAYGYRRWPGRPPAHLAGFTLAVAAGTAALAVPDTVALMMPVAVLAGTGVAPALVTVFLAADDLAMTGRATEYFTWLGAAGTAGFGLGTAVAGPLAERFGPAVALLCAAAVVLTAAAGIHTARGALRPG